MKFLKENPEEYDEAIEKMNSVESDARGTQWAYKAKDERKKVEKARAIAATEAWDELNGKLNVLVKQDKFGDVKAKSCGI